MRTNLYLDPVTYDLALRNNNLRVTTTLTEFVSQKLENKLKTFLGEFFANQSIGLPYFDRILGKAVDLNDINALFQSEIRSVEEVEEILKFDVNYDESARTYSVQFEVLASTDNEESETVVGELLVP